MRFLHKCRSALAVDSSSKADHCRDGRLSIFRSLERSSLVAEGLISLFRLSNDQNNPRKQAFDLRNDLSEWPRAGDYAETGVCSIRVYMSCWISFAVSASVTFKVGEFERRSIILTSHLPCDPCGALVVRPVAALPYFFLATLSHQAIPNLAIKDPWVK
jgi:hypothetical protein